VYTKRCRENAIRRMIWNACLGGIDRSINHDSASTRLGLEGTSSELTLIGSDTSVIVSGTGSTSSGIISTGSELDSTDSDSGPTSGGTVEVSLIGLPPGLLGDVDSSM